MGSTKPFSVIIADTMPDLELISKGQCFPRYRYTRRTGSSAFRESAQTSRSRYSSPTGCRTSTSSSLASASPGGPTKQGGIFDHGELFPKAPERIDNITDTALRTFRVRYRDNSITKDDIFHYVYGILHSPAYRERFANDLAKELPRIPFAPDFRAFSAAGFELAKLHLGYESGSEYPLEVAYIGDGEPREEHYRIGTKKMRFVDGDRSVLAINDHIRLESIPAEAHEYQVNGRTPLEWFIDRYRIVKDSRSGIVNDPNGWFDDPRDLVAAFRRIVHVSVKTVEIVRGLPEPFDEQRDV